jgi:hypothetical protein
MATLPWENWAYKSFQLFSSGAGLPLLYRPARGLRHLLLSFNLCLTTDANVATRTLTLRHQWLTFSTPIRISPYTQAASLSRYYSGSVDSLDSTALVLLPTHNIRLPFPIFADISNWIRFEVENMQAGDDWSFACVRVLETQLPAELAP